MTMPVYAVAATLAFQLRQLPDHPSSSPAKISRPSLVLATGSTFSVHPSAL